MGAQHSGQAPGIDAGDGDHPMRLQIAPEAALGAPVGVVQRGVANHQSGGEYPA